MQSFVERFSRARVAVIGDMMLDCYLYGDVSRISPEAPVPVVRATGEKMVAGGAANVAVNLASLGARVRVVGVCGNDSARDALMVVLESTGAIDTSGVIIAPNRRTTQKLRVVGAKQQIVRIDHEDVGSCSAEIELACIEAALRAVDDCDVVVLSDYGKGMCSAALLPAVIAYAKASSKPVLVDPKLRDFRAYRGATVITPNRKELSDATQMPCETDEEALEAVRVAQAMSASDVLLTRSEKGMSYFPLGGVPIHMPTVAQDVFDVSGAGDTVVAVLAASLACGFVIEDGMQLANHAAGIVVSKLGTATVSPDELSASIASERMRAFADGTLISADDAIALRWHWARQRLSVGYVAVHTAEVALEDVHRIQRVGEVCDRLLVAFEMPVGGATADQYHRHAEMLGALRGVSVVVSQPFGTGDAFMRKLQPDTAAFADRPRSLST